MHESKDTEGEVSYNDVANLVAAERRLNFLEGCKNNLIFLINLV